MNNTTDTSSEHEVARALGRLLDLIESARHELNLLCKKTAAGSSASDATEQLGNWLYAYWYSVPDRLPAGKPVNSAGADLVRILRAAVVACDRWEGGWVVMQSGESGSCFAGRAGATCPFRPGEYANLSRPSAPVVPGDNVAVTRAINWVDERSSFWCAQSIRGPPSSPLIRVYWSVDHHHVGRVLREIFLLLDMLEAKYSLKCPSRAEEFRRIDALVVYLEESTWVRCRPLMHELGKKLSPHLRPSVPPLTLKITRGVAFAEDVSGTQSFGQSRCLALASGVRAVLNRNTRSRRQGLSLLSESLRKNGVDPKQPWISRK